MKRWMLGLAILCFGCGQADPKSGTTSPNTGVGGGTGGGGGAGGSAPAGAKVLVTNQQHAPLPGVPVVAHDEDGNPLQQAITDDAGGASLVVPPGGSVSVLHAAGQRFQIRTVVAPPSGTVVLTVETPPAEPAPHAVTNYVLKLGSYPAGANMIVASLDGGCATAQAPAGDDIPFNDAACPDRASHTVWLAARDPQDKLLGWGRLVLGTQPGKSVAAYLPAFKTDLSTITLEIDNLPETPAWLTVSHHLAEGSTALGDHQTATSTGAAEYVVKLAAPAADMAARCAYASVYIGDPETGASVTRRACDASLPSTWSFDAGAAPWLYLTGLDTTDPARPEVTWSAVPAEPADYLELTLCWSVGPSQVCHVAALPPDHPPVYRLPGLPDELASFRPGLSASFDALSLGSWQSPHIADYADVADGLELHQVTGEGDRGFTWIAP